MMAVPFLYANFIPVYNFIDKNELIFVDTIIETFLVYLVNLLKILKSKHNTFHWYLKFSSYKKIKW